MPLETEARVIGLLAQANRAAADAIRFRRDPTGGVLASLRHRDAKALRAMASSALRT